MAAATKVLFLTFTLLCLLHAACSLIGRGMFQETQKMVIRQSFQELNRMKEESQHRTATLSRLLDVANSATNKDQLETLMEDLEEAAKEADRRKEEDRLRVSVALKMFNRMQPQSNFALKMLETLGDDLLIELSSILKHLMSKCKTVLEEKNVLFK